MQSETGADIRFVDWVRDVKVLVGALSGGFVAISFVVLFMSEVISAPEIAREAAQSARQAQTMAAEANAMATENRAFYDDLDRTLRITFCTSPFDLSEYAKIQLRCNMMVGGQE